MRPVVVLLEILALSVGIRTFTMYKMVQYPALLL